MMEIKLLLPLGCLLALTIALPEDKPLIASPFSSGAAPVQAGQIIELVVADTLLRMVDNKYHSYAINGLVPPRTIMLNTGQKAAIKIYNKTANPFYLELPESITTGKPGHEKHTVLKGGSFSSYLSTKHTGIFTYRIYQFEKALNGVRGSIVIK